MLARTQQHCHGLIHKIQNATQLVARVESLLDADLKGFIEGTRSVSGNRFHMRSAGPVPPSGDVQMEDAEAGATAAGANSAAASAATFAKIADYIRRAQKRGAI